MQELIDMQALIEKYRKHDRDRGSIALQVIYLTQSIQRLREKIKRKQEENPEKKAGRERALERKIGRRSTLLRVIKKKKPEVFNQLVKDLNLTEEDLKTKEQLRAERIAREYGKHEKDTSSFEFHIALLTERIQELSRIKDRKGIPEAIEKLSSEREKLMVKLREIDMVRYEKLVSRLACL